MPHLHFFGVPFASLDDGAHKCLCHAKQQSVEDWHQPSAQRRQVGKALGKAALASESSLLWINIPSFYLQ